MSETDVSGSAEAPEGGAERSATPPAPVAADAAAPPAGESAGSLTSVAPARENL